MCLQIESGTWFAYPRKWMGKYSANFVLDVSMKTNQNWVLKRIKVVAFIQNWVVIQTYKFIDIFSSSTCISITEISEKKRTINIFNNAFEIHTRRNNFKGKKGFDRRRQDGDQVFKWIMKSHNFKQLLRNREKAI